MFHFASMWVLHVYEGHGTSQDRGQDCLGARAADYNGRDTHSCGFLPLLATVQVWRVLECAELYQQLRPAFEQLPAHFQCAQHYHLGIHAAHPPMKLLKALAAAAHSRNGMCSRAQHVCATIPCTFGPHTTSTASDK